MSNDGHGEHILLVDDDPHLRTVLGDRLEHAGYQVTLAASGEQALEKLKDDDPDLIILDISMPGMGGIGFLKEISDERSKTRYPVLVLTARGAMESFFDTLDVDGFLAKPCPDDDLMRKIHDAFVRHPPARRPQPAAADSRPVTRVLIGENDPECIRKLRSVFTPPRYEADVVNSGPQIIERAVAQKPDVIVVRESMLRMTGRMVASVLDGMPATNGIPVILYDDQVSDLASEAVLANMALPRGVSALLRTSASDALRRAVDSAIAGSFLTLTARELTEAPISAAPDRELPFLKGLAGY